MAEVSWQSPGCASLDEKVRYRPDDLRLWTLFGKVSSNVGFLSCNVVHHWPVLRLRLVILYSFVVRSTSNL